MMKPQPRRGGLAPHATGWFVALLGTSVVLLSAVNGVRPILSYRALALGASPFELGVVVSTFAVLPLLLAVVIGRQTDRSGERTTILGGTVTVALAAALALAAPNLVVLALANALLGLGHTFYAVGSQALIANASTPSERDSRYGSYAVGVSLAQFVGPMLAGLLAGSVLGPGGAPRAFAGAIVLALGAALIAWRLPRHHPHAVSPAPGAPPAGTLADTIGIFGRPGMPAAMLAGVAVLTSADLLLAYLPAFGAAQGLPVEMVGLLLGAAGLTAILARVALPLLVARGLGRLDLLAASMALAAIGFVAVSLASGVVALLLFVGIIGFGLGFGQPLTLAWVAEAATPDRRATTLALRLTGNRLGQLTLPVAMGGLGGTLGLSAIFVATAGLLGLAVTLTMRARNLHTGKEMSPP